MRLPCSDHVQHLTPPFSPSPGRQKIFRAFPVRHCRHVIEHSNENDLRRILCTVASYILAHYVRSIPRRGMGGETTEFGAHGGIAIVWVRRLRIVHLQELLDLDICGDGRLFECCWNTSQLQCSHEDKTEETGEWLKSRDQNYGKQIQERAKSHSWVLTWYTTGSRG